MHIYCFFIFSGVLTQYAAFIRYMKTTPVLLPGKSHGWKNLVGCSLWGRSDSDMTERLHFHFSLSCIGEGNGNPLQSSCLENPRDGEAWWAAVSGVAQSRTRLKRLSSSSSSSDHQNDLISILYYLRKTKNIYISSIITFFLLNIEMVKNLANNAEDVGSIPGSGRSPRVRKWQPTSVFLPGKFMGRGALQVTVHGVAKDQTQLSTHAHSTYKNNLKFLNVCNFQYC